MKLKDRDTFLEIVDKIADIIKKYELRNVDKNIIKVSLANGDFIEYRITKDCIAHLLGVNTNALVATGLLNNTSSFEALKEMISKKNLLADMICNERLTLKSIFSEYINQKINSFFNNIFIDINETIFVCKYDRNIAINNGIVDPHKCQYIICKEDNEHNFYVLHLVKNNFFVPMSNQIFEDINEFNDYLTNILPNQSLTFISTMFIKRDQYDLGKKLFLTSDEKINHFNSLNEYAKKYNCTIVFDDDYIKALKACTNIYNRNKQQNSIISSIVGCISSKTIINEASLSSDPSYIIPDNLLAIIKALNDYIVNSSNGGEETYSDLQSQISSLREAKTIIESKNVQLQEQLDSANETISTIQARNQQLESAISTIGEAYQKTLNQN